MNQQELEPHPGRNDGESQTRWNKINSSSRKQRQQNNPPEVTITLCTKIITMVGFDWGKKPMGKGEAAGTRVVSGLGYFLTSFFFGNKPKMWRFSATKRSSEIQNSFQPIRTENI